MKLNLMLILWMMFVFSDIQSQQQGNVVEYFGKERVEKTEEGRILHCFEQGLLLNEAIIPGMLLGNQDVVLWQLANHTWHQPAVGDFVYADYPQGNKELTWNAVKADSNYLFTGIQRGWLYADYFSPDEKVVLLDATGHTTALVNGLPYEGDHYDYGYTLQPIRLKAGTNEFLFSYGRFQRLRASLVEPEAPVMLLRRDMTLPTILNQQGGQTLAAIRLLNTTDNELTNCVVKITLSTGEVAQTTLVRVPAMSQRKVPLIVPEPLIPLQNEKLEANVELFDAVGKLLHHIVINLKVQDPRGHHERTFLSNIDGSVQYFSFLPSLTNGPGQPLVLSLHGASVEATNQIRAYKPKDWTHIVAPTNRRPFGFNWEDWGRLDAFEVLAQAQKLSSTDNLRMYVTGHSMGGHGTWVMGGTFPGLFAAMAPAAGYPDIIAYRRTGSDTSFFNHPHYKMVYSSGLHARMIYFEDNYVQTPLYVLHGDADEVVPVDQARKMRKILESKHPNMVYFEYPGGTHWYGDESMDWPPLFDFLRQHQLKHVAERDTIVLHTANIGVNATNGWLTIAQQHENGLISRAHAIRNKSRLTVSTANVRRLSLSTEAFKARNIKRFNIDGQRVPAQAGHYLLEGGQWKQIETMPLNEKNPNRNGGFKTAFEHQFVLVYGTGGSAEEQQWNRQRAIYDADAFLYRANGAPELLADTVFNKELFKGRNIILYGNADNNKAWAALCNHMPFRAGNGFLELGELQIKGDDLGYYVVYPHQGSTNNVIGMVGGTGIAGAMAAVQNHYFSGITAFPDVLIFRSEWLLNGPEGIEVSGFFGYDWSVANGRWAWKKL
jgi:dienelactone hydrolase